MQTGNLHLPSSSQSCGFGGAFRLRLVGGQNLLRKKRADPERESPPQPGLGAGQQPEYVRRRPWPRTSRPTRQRCSPRPSESSIYIYVYIALHSWTHVDATPPTRTSRAPSLERSPPNHLFGELLLAIFSRFEGDLPPQVSGFSAGLQLPTLGESPQHAGREEGSSDAAPRKG